VSIGFFKRRLKYEREMGFWILNFGLVSHWVIQLNEIKFNRGERRGALLGARGAEAAKPKKRTQ
jgi:hypothetical protein